MHVCFLCNEYPPGQYGGVGTVTQTLGRSLAARGHQVTAVGCYRVPARLAENDKGVEVVRLPHASRRGTGFLVNGTRLRRALDRIHRRRPIDVLDGSETSLALVGRRFPAMKIIRMNGGHRFFSATLGREPRPWRSWLESRSFARADHLCAVSRFVADTTRNLLRLGDRAIEILPNPVDAVLFRPRPEIRPEADLIVFVGTVCEKKGVRELVLAMPAILRAVPTARLWIVGRDLRDPETGQPFSQTALKLVPLQVQRRILMKGPIEHARLPEILARATVCVYPSHMEALPLAWIEGMAMGKAVVASRTGPGSEVIEDGISGLLCNPHEPDSIAASVVRLLTDAQLRERIGAAARERVLNHFSEDALIGRNEAFFRRCVLPFNA